MISIECNPLNTGSRRLSSTGIHDPFPRSLYRGGETQGRCSWIGCGSGSPARCQWNFLGQDYSSISFSGRDNLLIPRLCSVDCFAEQGKHSCRVVRFSSAEVTLKSRRSFLLSPMPESSSLPVHSMLDGPNFSQDHHREGVLICGTQGEKRPFLVLPNGSN